MKTKKQKIFGYFAIALAMALVAGMGTSFVQADSRASAEAVVLAEKATVVESPFTQAVRDVRDSVVGVNNYGMVSPRSNAYGGFGFGFGFDRGYGRWPEEEQQEEREVLQGGGSGVVIAPGFVLTNYHVVDKATRLEISAGEDTYEASLIGHDELLDIAVLEVKKLKIQPVTIGDSDVLNVGDWAICIGHPLSFTGTTTVGIISALNREMKNASTDIYGRRTENVNAMIQTDAAINAGNSGGGMFNVAGELVGIPSMKITSSYYSSSTVEGIGMAIPINAAKPLIREAVEGKTIKSDDEKPEEKTDEIVTVGGKPRIGVTVGDLNSSSSAVMSGILPRGAYIQEVESGSPADKAGLKPGDIVVEVDGTVITGSNRMISLLQAKEAGQTVDMKIYRVEGLEGVQNYRDIPDGEYMDFVVELAILDNVKQ